LSCDRNGALLRANGNWQDEQKTAIEPAGLPPNDATILARYAACAYTAVVGGKNSATGVSITKVCNLR
jgi:hypothetical protein